MEEVQPVVESTQVEAPEAEVTANTETTPEVVEEKQAEEEKKFSQAELDDIIGKRIERERRKMLREMQQQAPAPKPSQELSLDQFATAEEYAEALAERKAEEKLRQRELESQVRTKEEQFRDREDVAHEKYEDYAQVVYKNPSIKITEIMAEAIKESEIGPDIAYYLGTNTKESDRISRMSQIAQIKEIGKIEDKLTANPPKRVKTTNAPPPITPVKTTNSSPTLDLSDPKSLEKLGTSAWIEADRARRIRELEAKNKH